MATRESSRLARVRRRLFHGPSGSRKRAARRDGVGQGHRADSGKRRSGILARPGPPFQIIDRVGHGARDRTAGPARSRSIPRRGNLKSLERRGLGGVLVMRGAGGFSKRYRIRPRRGANPAHEPPHGAQTHTRARRVYGEGAVAARCSRRVRGISHGSPVLGRAGSRRR